MMISLTAMGVTAGALRAMGRGAATMVRPDRRRPPDPTSAERAPTAVTGASGTTIRASSSTMARSSLKANIRTPNGRRPRRHLSAAAVAGAELLDSCAEGASDKFIERLLPYSGFARSGEYRVERGRGVRWC